MSLITALVRMFGKPSPRLLYLQDRTEWEVPANIRNQIIEDILEVMAPEHTPWALPCKRCAVQDFFSRFEWVLQKDVKFIKRFSKAYHDRLGEDLPKELLAKIAAEVEKVSPFKSKDESVWLRADKTIWWGSKEFGQNGKSCYWSYNAGHKAYYNQNGEKNLFAALTLYTPNKEFTFESNNPPVDSGWEGIGRALLASSINCPRIFLLTNSYGTSLKSPDWKRVISKLTSKYQFVYYPEFKDSHAICIKCYTNADGFFIFPKNYTPPQHTIYF